MLNLVAIEGELKKRLEYPYTWHQKQGNTMDSLTDFIYNIQTFDDLITELKARFGSRRDFQEIFDYALNRWYNYWSAQAVEAIFCSQRGVVPSMNNKNRLEDFSINGVTFDHKTSIYPKGFGHPLAYAQAHTDELIQWLYKNQSKERRFHTANRLFIVLHESSGHHWKLKAEVSFLENLVRTYVSAFDPAKLHKVQFPNHVTQSDIIWGIK